jgi:fermentation-respiration switch protein FrsA (DUF1100 family)
MRVPAELLHTLLFLALGLVLLNAWLYLQQPGMIFFPMRELEAVPAQWGLEYQDVSFVTEDGVALHGWYLPRRGAKRVLLFLHGNAGNISHRRDSLEIFHRLGLNVLIFDYRGYGRSAGRPSEPGLYRDAAAAWDYLTGTRGIDQTNIVVFGRSLGGAVAAQLSARVQPRALILESSMSSARDAARAIFPLLSRLVILRYEFDAAASLGRVTCPVLVLHSPQDEIMPFALGEKLYRAANEPKRFVPLQGDHNSGFLLSQPGYEQALASFLAALS